MKSQLKTTFTSFVVLVLMILGSTLNAQTKKVTANGKIVTKTRSVETFDKIAVSGSFDVVLKKGKEGDISIEASENIIEIIETEVKKNVLKINFKKGFRITNAKKILITVSYKDISSVILSGSGSISSEDTIDGDELNLVISGSGDMDFNVSTKNLKSVISGSADVKLKGSTGELKVVISGSGDIKASELKSERVNVVISGSGDADVYASKEISGVVSGSGDVSYYGNPDSVNVKSNGSGSVKKKD